MTVRRLQKPRRLVVDVTGAPGRSGAALAHWLESAAPARAAGTVDIALVGDARMRRLNREFRGVDRTTDVLSFPAEDLVAVVRPKTSPSRHLGDIAIATGVAAAQARVHGHRLTTELRILALHGLLHLLGYDHERDHGTMRRVEERLRRRAGLPVGLIVRGTGPDRTR